MYTAEQIANFFIGLIKDDPDNDMTNMKVNKLLYFAQGRYLAKYGIPLFSDVLEAWEHGPVVNSVYQKYKYCGNLPICLTDDDEEWYASMPSKDIDFLLDIYREYGKYSAAKLREMTHEKLSPWDQAFRGKSFSHAKIENNDIKEYFKSQPPLKEFDMKSILEKIPRYETYRDSNGVLIVKR